MRKCYLLPTPVVCPGPALRRRGKELAVVSYFTNSINFRGDILQNRWHVHASFSCIKYVQTHTIFWTTKTSWEKTHHPWCIGFHLLCPIRALAFVSTGGGVPLVLLRQFRMRESGFEGVSFVKPITFHFTGWLIGILVLPYYNPYILTG